VALGKAGRSNEGGVLLAATVERRLRELPCSALAGQPPVAPGDKTIAGSTGEQPPVLSACMGFMVIALMLLAGLVALYFGAEWLVRGGASLAIRLGVTPLLVGLTVVAYGTSTPELIVSTMAAAKGQGAIAIGNAVGSNIFNIGIILGLTAFICPMRVQLQLLKFDTPVMVGVALLFLVFFRDGQIQLGEAFIFLAIIVGYTVMNIRLARRQARAEVQREFDEGVPRLLKLSEAFIGLTIVAAGTSLPELASSLMAAWRKQPDIAIGNVVGSNIYNILAILGVSGVIAPPLNGPGVSQTDTLVMTGLSLVLVVIAWTGFKLRRWEGALLLALYGGYLWHLWPKP
jgi:cation:H+ antiporter